MEIAVDICAEELVADQPSVKLFRAPQMQNVINNKKGVVGNKGIIIPVIPRNWDSSEFDFLLWIFFHILLLSR